jgi:heterodisulfide reductase subunit A-like polyferredoxin
MANILDERKKGLEEEYFRRKEQEVLEKTRQRLAAEQREPDEASFMRCPKCSEKLQERIFNDIKVIAVTVATVSGWMRASWSV